MHLISLTHLSKVVLISWGVIFIIVNFEDYWMTTLWIIGKTQSRFYCFNTDVVLSNITYQVLSFFSVLHFVHWTPRRTADNRTCKKVQVLALSCVKRAGFPAFFTGIWPNCFWRMDCSPMNVILNASDNCVVTRGSPSFTIWFMEKSCVSIKSQFALMEPSWLKPSRGILTLVRSYWNLSSPKSVSQATGRTPFPQ